VSFKAGKKGDSVAAVARRYRVSRAQVAEWNSVGTSARFAPGQQIIVMVSKPAAKSSRVASGKESKTAARSGASPVRAAAGSSMKATSQSTAKTRRRTER
jgi:membrane-bound lytic murein transglycosylase D